MTNINYLFHIQGEPGDQGAVGPPGFPGFPVSVKQISLLSKSDSPSLGI